MKNKNSQSKSPKAKSQRQNNFQNFFSKKIMIALLMPILLIAILFAIFAIRDFLRLDVAFYDIDENSQTAITTFIKENFSGSTRFSVLTDKDAQNPSRVSKQYDFVFCYHGIFSERVSENAAIFPESFFALIPSSSRLRCENKKQIPILLNHYEVSYLKTILRDAKISIPETANAFENFLAFTNGKLFSPIFLAGNDDAIFLSFIGSLIESETGSAGYEKFISLLREHPDFEKMYQTPFAQKNGNDISLATILAKIGDWKKNGLLLPDWINVSEYDIEPFMRDQFVGAVFMPLDMHRRISLRTIANFSDMHFPIRASVSHHAILAPPLMMIKTSRRKNFLSLAQIFLSPDSQGSLSNMSQLAPATLQGTATDKQADDVRFWAATSPAGPFSGPDKEAFLTRDVAATFANEVRDYLYHY